MIVLFNLSIAFIIVSLIMTTPSDAQNVGGAQSCTREENGGIFRHHFSLLCMLVV